MKNTLEPRKQIGREIRIMGQEQNLSLYELKTELSASLQRYFQIPNEIGDRREDKEKSQTQYTEETVNGYLYGRAWPEMPAEDTVTVVVEAFKNALGKEQFGSDLKKSIREKILKIYSDYEKEQCSQIMNHELMQILFREPILGNFLIRYWDACSGLAPDEIELWDIISDWKDQERKNYLKKWSDQEMTYEVNSLFQSVTSPAFYQWQVIRNKNNSDSARKGRETLMKTPKVVDQKLYKVTNAELDSLLAIQKHMFKNEGKIPKKYILCFPSEIDLILLFKYFLPDAQKTKMMEKVRIKKATGDN